MTKPEILAPDIVEKHILLVRGQKVMLDADLARLYGVSTKRLNEQVRRNLKRFPSDFMFELTAEEDEVLRSQVATSKKGSGGRRYRPLVFTEQGVAMLSSVLNSERAIRCPLPLHNLPAPLHLRPHFRHHQIHHIMPLQQLLKIVADARE